MDYASATEHRRNSINQNEFFQQFFGFNDFFVFYLMIFSLSVFIVLGFQYNKQMIKIHLRRQIDRC